MTRESLIVGVAYGSDVELVTNILLDVVSHQKGVLKSPEAFVQFDDFGDSALIFSLNFFISNSFGVPRMRSEMRYNIDAQFRKNGVTIPFPQRDVHVFQQGPFLHQNASPKSESGKVKK
jgi:small-conductance mechanosensitive channel